MVKSAMREKKRVRVWFQPPTDPSPEYKECKVQAEREKRVRVWSQLPTDLSPDNKW